MSEAAEVPTFETIIVEARGAVGRLTLARPDRLNAMGATMLQELARAARWFDEQREVRAVIVRGQGRSFCAGADLRDPPLLPGMPGSGNTWLYRREVGQYGLRMADAVERMRATTIAQVHGHSVGGGIVLMAACDMRVVAEDTVMFIPEVDIGIPLAWGGIPRLVREIGPAMTKELVLTCRRFSAQEAKAMGFVNRVVPAARVEEEARMLAEEVAAKPSVPVVITKEHVNAVVQAMSAGITSFADGDALLGAAADAESTAAMRRYLETRLPRRS
ncbi:MAG TPA: enoyl-CoA hydratase/isomerase family protein [Candidatus Limnocylindrales bacterium]|nr:enoyl-CoA hydratase/isomerase family protein [Candidatus Limnocylindrales bacterium]